MYHLTELNFDFAKEINMWEHLIQNLYIERVWTNQIIIIKIYININQVRVYLRKIDI